MTLVLIEFFKFNLKMLNYGMTNIFLNDLFFQSSYIISNNNKYLFKNLNIYKSFSNFFLSYYNLNIIFLKCKFSNFLKNIIYISNNNFIKLNITTKQIFLSNNFGFFENCLFNNIISNEMGGAILINNNYFSLILIQTEFFNCLTIYQNYLGGGISIFKGFNVILKKILF